MFGGSGFGSAPFGSIISITITAITSERSFEGIAQEELGSERSFEGRASFFVAKKLNYRILVKNPAGTVLGEIDGFKELSFGKRLNNYGQAKFNMRVNNPKTNTLIDLRKNTIEIYKVLGFNETLVWAGEQALSDGQLNESGNNWLDVYNYSWLEQLKDRYTVAEKLFDQVDAGQIAWTLIDDTQDETNGSFGITQGTIEATKNRDRSYYNQNVMEAIINLANVASGFDFEITDGKVFNVSSIIGTDKTDSIKLEYGVNIKNMRITADFVNPVNRAIVLGEVVGEDSLQREETDDSGLQTAYKLREGRLSEPDVSEATTLQDKGTAMIRKYGQPLLKVDFDLVRNITPSIEDFGIGDGISLVVNSGYYNIDEQYRIFEWEMTFDKDNTETLSLVLGKFITI